MACILSEGINTWLASDLDRNNKFWEFDAVMVTYDSVEDKTTITNMSMNMGSLTDRGGLSTIIDGYIPIKAAVLW